MGAVNITSAADATFAQTITAASFTQAAGTGTTTFNGALDFNTATGLDFTGNIINISSTVNTTSGGKVEITNAGLLTIAGAGDMTLDGAFTQNGAGLVSTGGDITTTDDNITFNSATTLTGAVTLTSGTGIIDLASTVDNGGFLLTIDNDTNATDSSIAGVMSGTGGLDKYGTGVLALHNGNTYSGVTTINGGTVKIGADSGLGTAPVGATAGQLVFNGGTLQSTADMMLASNRGVALTGAGTFSTDTGTTLTYGGIMAGAGVGGLTKIGAGTLALSGPNTYSSGTTITTGTLQASNISALGTGFVTNNAILDVGTTDVAGIGKYTQGDNATYKVTVDSATTSGSLSSTVPATVSAAATSVVDMTVANNLYVPTSATFDIIDTASTGVSGVPGTINTLINRHVVFTGSTSTNNLVLTADRSANGYANDATDANARAVGNALDRVTNPTSDMTNVLNTLEGLNKTQTAVSLDTMVPEIDAGIINATTNSLNNFVGAALERTHETLNPTVVGAGASTSKGAVSTTGASTNKGAVGTTSAPAKKGVSSGDEDLPDSFWGKGYGSYLSQDTRKDVKGYDAWTAGTALGGDHMLTDNILVGMSGGYAYGNVDSDANNGNTYINSAQATIYGGYQDEKYPYYIDVAGSFAWNWYNGKRDISVGSTISRNAKASYDGQQYGLYLGGGYTFDMKNNLKLTPIASLQWSHLRLAGYTETEAGALNLSVDSQNYDMLQSGIGAKLEYPVKMKCGILTPEVHGKWLYDFIGDDMAMTSTFTGGGPSFNSNGFKPAKSSFDLGGKLSLDLKNDVSIVGEFNTELKDQYYGLFGSASLRYKF
ncbi:MAG: autotransporter domain-containing protein [Candidatus Omnitrophica bacterium]|nr:autotransporter domain-containing protein [Candidatus Omnitrophota bacterium]